MKSIKRILAVVLSVMLLLSVLPLAAFAQEEFPFELPVPFSMYEPENESRIDLFCDTYLDRDYYLKGQIRVRSNEYFSTITLDLNGHHIYSYIESGNTWIDAACGIYVDPKDGPVTLIIKDSSMEDKQTWRDPETGAYENYPKGGFYNYNAFGIYNCSNVIIEGGVISGSGLGIGTDGEGSSTTINNGVVTGMLEGVKSYSNNSDLTVNGGVVISEYCGIVTDKTKSGSTITINGGQIIGSMRDHNIIGDTMDGQAEIMSPALLAGGDDTLNINGGYFYGSGCLDPVLPAPAVFICSGQTNITGGTFVSKGDLSLQFDTLEDYGNPFIPSAALVVAKCPNYPGAENMKVSISGGTFISEDAPVALAVVRPEETPAGAKASGGTFISEFAPAANVEGEADDDFITITGGTFLAQGSPDTTIPYDHSAYVMGNDGRLIPANAAPTVEITPLTGTDRNITTDEGQAKILDVGYKFTAQDDASSVQQSAYRYWSADYVLTADRAVPAGSITIAGQSDHYSEKYWKALTPDTDIAGNTEVRLLKTMLGEVQMFSYEDICTLVHDFKCGAIANTLAAKDIELNVTLRLYETEYDPVQQKYVEKQDGQVLDIDNDIDYTFLAPAKHNNGSSLTLDDAIALNAYLDIDSYNCAADAYVKLNYNQNADARKAVDYEDVIVPVSEATKYIKQNDPWNGTYRFSFRAAPAQYAEDITIELYQSADAEVPIYTTVTNVKTKCEQVITLAETNPEEYGDYAKLCKSLADYCRASQLYFGYEASAAGYYNDVTGVSAQSMDVPQVDVGFVNSGYSFTIVSGLEANIFFDGYLKINSISVDSTKGTNLIKANKVSKSGKACINIKGIASGNIDNRITVKTNRGNITFAATNIAKAIVSGSNNTDFVNLAKAMYLYSVQASSYFNC